MISRPRLSLLYAASAVLLVPWIVVLFLTQESTGLAHGLTYIAPSSAATVVVGMLSTVTLVRRRSPWVAVAGTFTASMIVVVTWFHLLTGTALSVAVAVTGSVVLLFPVVVASGWVGGRTAVRRGIVPTVPSLGVAVYLIIAVAVCVLAVRVGLITPAAHRADHLRLVWTGLDVMECVALAATARTLRTGSPSVAIAATCTATLLLCDAWFNVGASTGWSQLSAAVMALVEVPLAALSAYVAAREIISWPIDRDSPKPARSDRTRSAS